MKEQLITFETAKLAKKCGFDIPSRGYNHAGQLQPSWHWDIEQYGDMLYYFSPTQSLLQKWLRENKNLCVLVELLYSEEDFTPFYDFKISKTNKLSTLSTSFMQHNSYEEALEAGLQEALNYIT